MMEEDLKDWSADAFERLQAHVDDLCRQCLRATLLTIIFLEKFNKEVISIGLGRATARISRLKDDVWLKGRI